MKLDLDTGNAQYQIRSYTEEGINVNGDLLSSSFVILPDELLPDWSPREFSDLNSGHFEQIARLRPELVIIGTGSSHRFVAAELLRPLLEAGIGVECMVSSAACRCYAVLTAENRRVAAAFIFEG